MFAVVEDFESIEDLDMASTCLTHTETKAIAEKVAKESKQLGFDFRFERYDYRVVEFKGECPNCGRTFEF